VAGPAVQQHHPTLQLQTTPPWQQQQGPTATTAIADYSDLLTRRSILLIG
jgi:hypothetical protein